MTDQHPNHCLAILRRHSSESHFLFLQLLQQVLLHLCLRQVEDRYLEQGFLCYFHFLSDTDNQVSLLLQELLLIQELLKQELVQVLSFFLLAQL